MVTAPQRPDVVPATSPRPSASQRRETPVMRISGVVAVAIAALALSYPRALGPSLTLWLGLAALVGVAAILISPSRRLPAPPWSLVVLGCWMTASVLWSQSPDMTRHGLVLYGSMSAVAVLAVAQVRLQDVPLAFGVGLGLVIALSVGATIFLQDALGDWSPWAFAWDGSASFQGLYVNRNILAYTVVVLAPAIFCLPGRLVIRTTLGGACLVGTAVLLTEIRSATGLLGLAVVAGTAGLMSIGPKLVRRYHPRTSRVLGSTSTAVGLASVIALGVAAVKFLGKDMGTLSGRLPLWSAILDVSRDHPFLGVGWGTVWRYHWLRAEQNPVRTEINRTLGAPLAHGHNAVLDVLPQIGIVGVLLFIVVQVWILVKFMRAAPSPVRRWAILTLVAINTVGLTEPMWSIPIGWGLLTSLAVVASRLGQHRGPATD